MIYEAILYQGMTIDLNTQKKNVHVWTHTQLLTQMTIRINQIQCLYIFRRHLCWPILFTCYCLINTKIHKPGAWCGFDVWSDSEYYLPFLNPFNVAICKSILSLFYFIDADSAYILAAVLSIDCHRCLEETQQQCVSLAGMSITLACLLFWYA